MAPAPPPPAPLLVPVAPEPEPVLTSVTLPQDPNWRSKTDVFRERMAEIKKTTTAVPKSAPTPTPSIVAAPEPPRPSVQPPTQIAPPPSPKLLMEPKKKGCFGLVLVAVVVVVAGVASYMRWWS